MLRMNCSEDENGENGNRVSHHSLKELNSEIGYQGMARIEIAKSVLRVQDRGP